jgi:hypothetical protein
VILRREARFVLLGWLLITVSFIWANVSLTSFGPVFIDVIWLLLTVLLVWTAPRD